MKKIICIFLLVTFVVCGMSSCTKEEVKPADGNSIGGGVSGKI